MAKVIFHIDLNSFFASAEEILDPSLVGKPVAVSGLSRRSVVSTANYEARTFGVKSAMPVQEALKLCPQLVVISGNYAYYQELSNKFIDYIKQYTPLVEQASIDECYADMTEIIKKFKRPLDLPWKIQQELYSYYGLKCSIGIGPNRFLAKMASDMRKPMGITVLRKNEVKTKLWPLPINEMYGIGKKTTVALKNLNIETIGDLAVYPNKTELSTILGKNTQSTIEKCYGIGSDEIVMTHDIKSMSNESTFATDVTDYEEIKQKFYELSEQLANRLKKKEIYGNNISITIRYFTFETIVRSKKLDNPIETSEQIFEQAMLLFDENYDENAVRLVGIGIGSLNSYETQKVQMSLFEEVKVDSNKEILSDLNKQLSHPSLKFASTLLGKDK